MVVGFSFGGGVFLWLCLLPVAHGVPSYMGLAGNLLRVRHRPVPAFAVGRDACGRAWGQDAPARPGESRWRLVAVGGRVLALVEFDAWVRAR